MLIFIDSMVMVFLVVMVIYSIQMVENARFQVMQSFRAAMVPAVLSVPVAMGLAGLQLIFKIAISAYQDLDEMSAQKNIDI